MSRPIEAEQFQQDVPPSPVSRDPGIREAALLLVGATWASLMFDLPVAAIIAGALAVVAWAVGMARPGRLSWQVTVAIGAGLVVSYMWWPDNAWAVAAVTLMWIGVLMLATGAARAIAGKRSTRDI